MILLAKICIPIISALTALAGLLSLLLLALTHGALALESGFHWLLLISILCTALFSIYSFVALFFGDHPRREARVLVSAFGFLVIFVLLQSPAAHDFVRGVAH